MGLDRATVIGFMRGAIRRGQSAGGFIRDMKAKGLSYRRTDMLSDWRSEGQLETKKDLMRFVRKDYYPTQKAIAIVDYNYSQEYMYKCKVESRLRPGEPVTERFVNIMSDVPMTPAMVEQAVIEKWSEWEDYTAETLEKIIPWQASQTTMV